jgi:hypothetical protein
MIFVDAVYYISNVQTNIWTRLSVEFIFSIPPPLFVYKFVTFLIQ